MDSAFIGTWELDISKTQGLAEYGKTMGMDEARLDAYSKMQYSFTLSKDGDTYNVTVDFKGAMPKMNYSIKAGETIDYTGADGTKSKLTLTLDGTNPVETYEIPDKNAKWTVRRTVSGDVLTSVSSVGDVKMTQVLNKK